MKVSNLVVLFIVMLVCVSGASWSNVRVVGQQQNYQMMEYNGLVLVMDTRTAEIRTARLEVSKRYKSIKLENDTKILFFEAPAK